LARKTDIRLRRSNTANALPTSGNLSDGELAMNTMDGALYFKKSDNTIITAHDDTIMHIDSTNSRIGIGTVSPNHELDIQTSGSGASIRLKRVDSNDNMVLLEGSSYGYLQNQTGPLGLGGTGDERALLIASNNSVGIGTYSPAYKLDVQEANGGVLARFKDTDSTHKGIVIAGDTNAGWVGNNASTTGEGIYYQNSINAMRFYRAGNEEMRLSSTGLGVGIATSRGKLEVQNSTTATDTIIASATFQTAGDYHDMILGDGRNYAVGLRRHITQSNPDWLRPRLDFIVQNQNTYLPADRGIKMSIKDSGDVGIGTTSPAGNLHIKDSDGEATLLIQSGTNTSSSKITFGDGIDVSRGGIEYKSTDDMVFSTNNVTEQMVIRYTGNVGIGVLNPGAKLQVDGAIVSEGGSFASNLETVTDAGLVIQKNDYIYSDDNDYLRKIIGHTATNHIQIGQQNTALIGDILLYPGSTGNIRVFASGSEDVRINSSGNMGVGIISPVARLDVAGNGAGPTVFNYTYATDDGIRVFGNEAAIDIVGNDDGNHASSLLLRNSNDGFALINNAASDRLEFKSFTATGAGFSAHSTGSSVSGLTDILTLQKTGNVGIGISAPTEKLHLKGSGSLNIKVEPGTTPGNNSGIQLGRTDGGNAVQMTTALAADVAIPGIPGVTVGSDSGGLPATRIRSANSSNGHIVIAPKGTEAVRISSGGIVTINDSAEQGWSGAKLNIGDTTDGANGINILSTTTGNGYIIFSDVVDNSANEYANQIRFDHTDNFMSFSIGGSQRLKLASNGAVTFNDAFTFPTSIGAAGQILKVPATGTELIWGSDAGGGSATLLTDGDGDTLIQVEESTDEDIIRFDAAGIERFKIGSDVQVMGTTDFNITGANRRINFTSGTGTVKTTGASALNFGTNNTDRMTITATGNVGIGTASPTEKLHVVGGAATVKIESSTNEASLKYDNSTTTGVIKLANNDLKTELGGSEVMRILANGNVGIGTASPSSKLHVSDGGAGLEINPQTANDRVILFAYDRTASTYQSMNLDATDFRFNPSGTEKARITSDGALFVGSTSDSGTGYHYIKEDGFVRHKRAGSVVGIFDRGTNDGEVILIRKDGATTGRIGTESGRLVLGTGNTGLGFLDVGQDRIIPRLSTGGNANASIDLGDGASQFRDLYLSGLARVSTQVRLNKQGTADVNNQEYDSATLVFEANAWDTNGGVARDVNWTVKNETTASVYPDSDLKFYEPGNGLVFELHGRGTTGHVDPKAGTFYGNVAINAGSGSNAGAGNLTIAGDLTVNGTTVTNSASNTTIEDALIELGSGNTGANSNDLGFIFERGTTGDNVFFGFDESEDEVAIGYTTATGASTGGITRNSFTNFRAGQIQSGNTSIQGLIRVHHGDGAYLDVNGNGITFNRSINYLKPSTDGNKLLYLGDTATSSDWREIIVKTVDGLSLEQGDLTVNTDTLKVDTTNSRVGVGTATPAVLLDVNIDGNTARFSRGATQRIEVSANSGAQSILSTSGTNKTFMIGTTDANQLRLQTNGSYAIAIDNSQKVGIGTTTPNAPLEIHGADIATGTTTTASSVLRLVRDVVDPTHTLRKDSAVDFMLSRQQAVANNLPYTRLDIRLSGTTDSSSPTLDVMSLLHNGNVGIGTTSPQELLHLEALEPLIRLDDTNSGLHYIFGQDGDGFKFTTNNSTYGKYTFDSNVGIGTTNPKAKLQVEEYGIDTTETSTTAVTQVAIHTFPIADFRSARFTIQVTNSTDSTYHTTEILVIHDGTTAYMTEFGEIHTGSSEEAVFDADILSTNMRLLATPASTDAMEFKVVCHSVTV